MGDVTVHTTPCVPCGGSGLVPRSKRRLPNGELDPFDTIEWQKVICSACSGSGAKPLNLSTIAEKPAALAPLALPAQPSACNHPLWMCWPGGHYRVTCPSCE